MMRGRINPYKLRLFILFVLSLLVWSFDNTGIFDPFKTLSTALLIGLPFVFNRRFSAYEENDDPFIVLIDRLALSNFIFSVLLILVFPYPIGAKGISILLGLNAPLAFFMHVQRARWVFFMNLSLALLFQIILAPVLIGLLLPYALLATLLLTVQNLILMEQNSERSAFNSIHKICMSLIVCFTLGLSSLLNQCLPVLPTINLKLQQQRAETSAPDFKMALFFFVALALLGFLLWRQMRKRSPRKPLEEAILSDEEEPESQQSPPSGWPASARATVVERYQQHLKTLADTNAKLDHESAREYASRLKDLNSDLQRPLNAISTLFEKARYDPNPIPEEAPAEFERAVESVEESLQSDSSE
jgi:hypothetical protein